MEPTIVSGIRDSAAILQTTMPGVLRSPIPKTLWETIGLPRLPPCPAARHERPACRLGTPDMRGPARTVGLTTEFACHKICYVSSLLF